MATLAQRSRPILREAYRRYGVLPRHLAGLTEYESGWDRYAVSPAGARYLTQFMPSTGSSYGVYGKGKGAIRSQLLGAAHYLHDLGYRRGNAAAIRLALASYNAGPGNPGAAGDYPEQVLSRSRKYAGIGHGTGNRAGGGGGGGAVSVTQPSVSRGQVEPGGAGIAALLAQLRDQERPVVPSAGVAPPSFSAHAALPQGYRQVPSSPPVADAGPRLSDLLGAVEGLTGAPPPGSTVTPGSVRGGRQNAAGGGSGGLRARADGWYGTKTLAQTGKGVAADMGIPISSEKRERKTTSTGNISDHWLGNRKAWADDYDTPGIDSATGHKLARRVAKAYGVKYIPNSYASGGTVRVNGRLYKIQILYGSGVEHGDHVHVGIHRLL